MEKAKRTRNNYAVNNKTFSRTADGIIIARGFTKKAGIKPDFSTLETRIFQDEKSMNNAFISENFVTLEYDILDDSKKLIFSFADLIKIAKIVDVSTPENPEDIDE